MSTIFADKFKNTSGGNPVQINQLRGIDTAGSITVQGEGTATTNLQQGLNKLWVNLDGGSVDGTANLTGVRDSLNCTSVVDNGTGDHTVNFTNATGNNLYVLGSHTQRNASTTENSYCSSYHNDYDAAHTTTSFRISTTRPDNASHEDEKAVMLSLLGDLA